MRDRVYVYATIMFSTSLGLVRAVNLLNRILVIDIGNTNVKRCVVEPDGSLGEVLRHPTKEIETLVPEIAAAGLPVALSCVRSGVGDIIKHAVVTRGTQPFIEVNAAVVSPVSGFYAGMGADRVADVAAAWTNHVAQTRPVAVIGLGTGTALTAVNAAGKFSGGFTTLGLGSICQSLTAALPTLPAIEPDKATNFDPGFDIYNTLCRGTVAGHVGLIEKWISIFRQELGPELFVVATGGWSALIASFTEQINIVDPVLTLKGIALIANQTLNQGK